MGNKPIKKFNDRLLSVAVWKNKGTNSYGEETEFHTVSISRGYKDRNGEFKSTHSLRPDDLPAVRDLLTQAEDFLNGNTPETADDVL
jgi:hypothetical protein